jgi:hypothetical protein
MPTMGQGEAIAFGEGVSLPSRITFDRLPSDAIPRTTTATFSESWANDVQDNGFLADVVSRWRLQSHFSFNEAAPPEGGNGAPPAASNGPAAAGRPVAAPAAAPVGPSQPFGRAHNTREPSLPPMRGFGGGSRGFGRNS